MPARIDPGLRRQQVIEAAFRLVVAEGLDGLSLRKVAAESGLNIGSVRHYFDGHHDLLVAAAEEAGDRMGRRLARHPVEALRGMTGEAAVDALQGLVEELLPVDEERRGEAVVVLELILASRTRQAFRPAAARMGDDLAGVLTEAFAALDAARPALQAAQLAALIGGLTIDALTPHGAQDADHLRATLRAHLRMQLRMPDGA
jgi:AcrR family transcriptional regulator